MSDDEASTVAPSERPNSSNAAEVVKRAQEDNTQKHGTGESTTVDCVEQAAELCVIYSDEDIVVLDKPSGLRTVPGKPSEGSEESSRAQVSASVCFGRLRRERSAGTTSIGTARPGTMDPSVRRYYLARIYLTHTDRNGCKAMHTYVPYDRWQEVLSFMSCI